MSSTTLLADPKKFGPARLYRNAKKLELRKQYPDNMDQRQKNKLKSDIDKIPLYDTLDVDVKNFWIKKSGEKAAKNPVARGMSGYNFYMREFSKDQESRGVKVDVKEGNISKNAGIAWRNLSEREKNAFREQAVAENESNGIFKTDEKKSKGKLNGYNVYYMEGTFLNAAEAGKKWGVLSAAKQQEYKEKALAYNLSECRLSPVRAKSPKAKSPKAKSPKAKSPKVVTPPSSPKKRGRKPKTECELVRPLTPTRTRTPSSPKKKTPPPSPKTRTPSPKTRTPSPKKKCPASPKPKTPPSPKPKTRTPSPKTRTPSPKTPSPKRKGAKKAAKK